MVLKAAAVHQWEVSTVDVKTAFLNAPVDEAAERGVVIVEPPRILREAGVLQHPDELWLVRKALYGLVTSPKDWCTHRDRHIKEFQWEGDGRCYRVEKTMQDDMWAIRSRGMGEEEWSLVGLCATYVDDIIITGSVEVVKGIHQKIQESWKIGAPSWVEDGGEPVRFLGMEIEKKGGNFVIHQRAYLENLFLEYEESGKANLNQVKMPEVEENIEMSEVTRAQKETGELLWVAGRTRPDISLAVNTMCEWATKRPKGVIDIGRQVRAYLRETRDESLVIRGAEEEAGSQEDWKTVKVFSDASYASSGFKSITGVVGCLGGTPITWQTSRQAFVTLSTAEAELMALLEGLITARSMGALVKAVFGGEIPIKLHSDSTAAIAIAAGTTSSWRTRHLRIRAAGLTEALRSREIILQHVAGTELVADGMTKQLVGQPLRSFKKYLGLERTEAVGGIEIKKIDLGGKNPDPKFLRGLGVLIAVASMVTCAEASEDKQRVVDLGPDHGSDCHLGRYPLQSRSGGSAEVVQA